MYKRHKICCCCYCFLFPREKDKRCFTVVAFSYILCSVIEWNSWQTPAFIVFSDSSNYILKVDLLCVIKAINILLRICSRLTFIKRLDLGKELKQKIEQYFWTLNWCFDTLTWFLKLQESEVFIKKSANLSHLPSLF